MAGIKDFATGIVVTAPSPATSGVTLTLQTGEGARMPAVPFFATAHPATEMPTLDNAEKVSVTDVTGDVLTIVRGQGDTTAKSIVAGWRLSNALFADNIAVALADLTDDATHRLVTDTEKTTWNAKQAAMGSDDNYVTDAEKANLHAPSSDNQTASTVANTPAGNIAATTVQAAINELDGEKQPLATVLTNTTAAFTTAQETKLSGIATGATNNTKAAGTDIDTGTDDAKFLTSKAVNDSHNIPDVAPGTSGNVLQSNGTDWISATPNIFNGCKVYRSSSTTISNSAYNQMQWNAEAWDTNNYHDNSTNTTRLTVPSTGYYRVTWKLSWPLAAGIVDAWVCVNGTSSDRIAGQSTINNASGNTHQTNGSATLYLSANDYVELWPFQTSGGTMTLTAQGATQTYFQIEKIGV